MKGGKRGSCMVAIILILACVIGVLILSNPQPTIVVTSGSSGVTPTPTVITSQCQPTPNLSANQKFYRAGNSLAPQGDEGTQVDANGNITASRARGPSFNTIRAKLPLDKVKQLGVYSLKISDLPKGLYFRQRGNEPSHYELVPDCDMPQTQYLALLYKLAQSFKYEP